MHLMLHKLMHVAYHCHMAATATRRSVPLDQGDLTRLTRVDRDSLLRAILARHAGVERVTSEAALLHTLVTMGLDLLEREADEERYAQLAVSQDDEDRDFHAAMRSHRRAA